MHKSYLYPHFIRLPLKTRIVLHLNDVVLTTSDLDFGFLYNGKVIIVSLITIGFLYCRIRIHEPTMHWIAEVDRKGPMVWWDTRD